MKCQNALVTVHSTGNVLVRNMNVDTNTNCIYVEILHYGRGAQVDTRYKIYFVIDILDCGLFAAYSLELSITETTMININIVVSKLRNLQIACMLPNLASNQKRRRRSSTDVT